MKVKSESEVTQSCPALRDPMDCSPPGSSTHGIFQARVLESGATAISDSPTKTNLGLEETDHCHIPANVTDEDALIIGLVTASSRC